MIRCTFAIFALAALPAAASAQAPLRITAAERIGDRVHIRIAAPAGMTAVQSEPFHLGGGRTRVFITIPGGTLDVPLDTLVPGAGMLALRADAYNGAVRVTADVAGLADYGVDPADDGMELWLDLARPAQATAPPPAPPPAATKDDLRTRAAAIANDVLERASIVASMAVQRARAVDVHGTPLRIALLVTLLLLTAVAWRVASRAASTPAPSSTTPADAATARIRRARELASEGLDADGIARGSGVSRDVAALLVARRRSDEAAAPGTLFRAKLRRELRSGK